MTNAALISKVAARTMRWPFRVWGFGEAIALRGLLAAAETTGDPEPAGFVHGLLRAWLGKGVARSPEDHVAPGRELLALYEITRDQSLLEGARKLAALHESFPANRHGARMHRPDQPGWRHQIWVDCMDVDAPFLVRLGQVTGEERYFDQGAEEIRAYARALQDSSSGLFFHGFESACGRNGQLWARGNGWALLGLVGTLRHLPSSHPLFAELRDRLIALCAGLAAAQDPAGLWHTVIPDPQTYLESTLAAMAACALHEAFTVNLLDKARFGKMQVSARAAVKRQIGADGSLQLVSDATPVGEFQVYATRPFGVFPWGQGPLLLMLAQE